MRTVQMTLDDDLIVAVDEAVAQLQTNRSAFTRKALREALARLREIKQEERHSQGYAEHPVTHGEFSDLEAEQVWGDN